jgi:hypothetical protein
VCVGEGNYLSLSLSLSLQIQKPPSTTLQFDAKGKLYRSPEELSFTRGNVKCWNLLEQTSCVDWTYSTVFVKRAWSKLWRLPNTISSGMSADEQEMRFEVFYSFGGDC